MAPPIRVLHVDDDRSFGELARRFLERQGLDVVSADCASAGLEALDGSIDCVVSDYEMPTTDGLEFLEAVRERTPELPFVLFTGKGSEEIASEAISAGVTDYLQKETSTEQFALLANRIDRAVTERRTESALRESERMLSTLVSNLPGVVYRCRNEPSWPMEYISGDVADVTGYDAAAFLDGTVHWGDMIADGYVDPMWEAVQDAIASREPFEVSYPIVDADGEERWMREQGQPVFDDAAADEPVAIEGFITDVSDRRRRERELSEYDRLVDALGAPVYTTDAEGRITTFNERAEAVTGFDAEDVVGEPVSRLLNPGEIQRSEAVIRDVIESGGEETRTYDITVRCADGGTIDLANHLALLTADDGAFRGTVGVLRRNDDDPDVRIRHLHDATRDLMAETDPDRIAALTVRAASEVLGLPIATVRFAGAGDLRVAATTEATTEQMGERPPLPIDGSIVGAAFVDGERRVEHDLRGTDVIPELGSVRSAAFLPLGGHGVFVVGGTEPHAFDEGDIQLATILAANAEAALDSAGKEAALRRERDDLAALLENIPDPTVEAAMTDGEPIVRRVNPAFETVFGYDSEDVVGENLDDFILPPEYESAGHEANHRIQAGEEFHGEVRRLAVDGPRDFILHVVPHDPGESVTRGYAIYTNITEQKQRERELARQNERLDQFASVVSHDLRNPLSVAKGRLDLAWETGDDAHFEIAEEAHDRMAELIDGLLALARQGELADDPVPVDVRGVATDAWGTVDTGGGTLAFEDPGTLVADPDRLRQLLENLYRNAVEHGDASVVTVGGLDDGFYVADDGDGIPPDERDAVLESGYARGDGTGFGLAIVDSIAEAHGWSITVTDGEDGGARFEFRDEGV